jgi:threonine dehydrogenase-like Zn-dependent dehydrogenase
MPTGSAPAPAAVEPLAGGSAGHQPKATGSMRAWQWRGPGDHGLITTAIPAPAEDEVLVAVEASGLCGTDLRILAGDYSHARPAVVIGHEFAGTVVALGERARGFVVGDLVAADPNVYCLDCEWCRRQAYNLCASVNPIGVSRAGSMAEYVTVPARLAVKLPGAFDPALGALIEPLACVLHGMERGGVVGGRTIAVYGAGAIGLMAVVVAVDLGLEVTVVEPLAPRRNRAQALGAAAVERLAGGAQFDYVLDASGAAAAVADGLGRLRKRGTFIQMGVTPQSFELPWTPYQVYQNEWRLIGSNSVADCYQRAAALMPSISEPMRRLVTHTLSLAELDRAIELIADPAAVKVQVDPRR